MSTDRVTAKQIRAVLTASQWQRQTATAVAMLLVGFVSYLTPFAAVLAGGLLDLLPRPDGVSAAAPAGRRASSALGISRQLASNPTILTHCKIVRWADQSWKEMMLGVMTTRPVAPG
jgi:hypothetical protein